MPRAVFVEAGGALVSVVTYSKCRLRWGVLMGSLVVSFCFFNWDVAISFAGLWDAGGVFCPIATSVVLGSVVAPTSRSVVGRSRQELALFCCSDRLHPQCGLVICGV